MSTNRVTSAELDLSSALFIVFSLVCVGHRGNILVFAGFGVVLLLPIEKEPDSELFVAVVRVKPVVEEIEGPCVRDSWSCRSGGGTVGLLVPVEEIRTC